MYRAQSPQALPVKTSLLERASHAVGFTFFHVWSRPAFNYDDHMAGKQNNQTKSCLEEQNMPMMAIMARRPFASSALSLEARAAGSVTLPMKLGKPTS